MNAKYTRLDKSYELAADFEIFKYQLTWIFNRFFQICFWSPSHVKQDDLTADWNCCKKMKKDCLKNCARETVPDKSADSDEETDEQKIILKEIRDRIISSEKKTQGHKTKVTGN